VALAGVARRATAQVVRREPGRFDHAACLDQIEKPKVLVDVAADLVAVRIFAPIGVIFGAKNGRQAHVVGARLVVVCRIQAYLLRRQPQLEAHA
jgi:hypothetical protein